MTLAAGTKLGPYEILAPLGAGGMGEVYRARDTRLGRDVAVKVLPAALARDAQRLGRFGREAKVLASLSHPNIAPLFGFEESGVVHALVMELVEGPTLADRIKSGAIPVEEALPMAKQIAEALEYAHERGIVHRDLKPANIKLAGDDTVKILDFGLAKAVEGDAGSPDLSNSPTLSDMATMAGVVLGTAAYMSPEQAKGKSVDRRADIWAFGCVLYEMLAGQTAFRGETATDTLAAVIRGEPDWSMIPSSTSPSVHNLLHRCLRKDVRQRLQSIGDARIALEEVLSGELHQAVPVPQAPASRRALPWFLVGVAAILAALFAFELLHRPAPPSQVLRYSLAPESASDLSLAFALSPDGTNLAFVAGSGDQQMIWLRPLDSLAAHSLPGTEGGDLPFWSPDGKSLGFFAGGKLKRVEIAGGPAQSLADASALNPRGGTWSSQGIILFSPDFNTPLMKVSAAGGASAPATALDNSRGDLSHRWPEFLPDGRHFIFLVRTSDLNKESIAVGLLDSTQSQTLIPSNSRTVFAAGHLIFSKDNTLLALRFDPQSLKVSGGAVPIAENVPVIGESGPTGFVPVSASENGILAYRNAQAVTSQFTIFDRSGKVVRTLGPPKPYSTPALSPDGRRLVFAQLEPEMLVTSLWTMDIETAALSRFTFERENHVDPVWSPDGRMIYYASIRAGEDRIFRKKSDGSGAAELVRQSRAIDEVTLDVSHDGRHLLISSTSSSNPTYLVALSLEHSDERLTIGSSAAAQMNAAFSPDDHYIAYVSDETGRGEIYVTPFPPTGGKWQVSASGGAWPAWSRDGRELFFVSADFMLMSASFKSSPAVELGAPRPLFRINPADRYIVYGRTDFCPLPDGQHFLVNQLVNGSASSPVTVVVNWPATLSK